MSIFKSIMDALAGYKTYIMIFIAAVDQIGVVQGWWEAGRLREIFEFTLGAMFLRMGVKKGEIPVSGSVPEA